MSKATIRSRGTLGALLFPLLLTHCEDNTLMTAVGEAPKAGARALVRTSSVEPGSECPEGGVSLAHGSDDNGDGELQEREVDASQVLCHGADGAAGRRALVLTTAFDGAQGGCNGGGVRIDVGMDDGEPGGEADSGVLEPAEVDETRYVCHGARGPAGPQGPTEPSSDAGPGDDAGPDAGSSADAGPDAGPTVVDCEATLTTGGCEFVDGPGVWNCGNQDLSGVNLSGCDLTDASFFNTNVTNAIFHETNLTGANFFDATVTGADWNDTTCPTGTNSDANADTCCGAFILGQVPTGCAG